MYLSPLYLYAVLLCFNILLGVFSSPALATRVATAVGNEQDGQTSRTNKNQAPSLDTVSTPSSRPAMGTILLFKRPRRENVQNQTSPVFRNEYDRRARRPKSGRRSAVRRGPARKRGINTEDRRAIVERRKFLAGGQYGSKTERERRNDESPSVEDVIDSSVSTNSTDELRIKIVQKKDDKNAGKRNSNLDSGAESSVTNTVVKKRRIVPSREARRRLFPERMKFHERSHRTQKLQTRTEPKSRSSVKKVEELEKSRVTKQIDDEQTRTEPKSRLSVKKVEEVEKSRVTKQIDDEQKTRSREPQLQYYDELYPRVASHQDVQYTAKTQLNKDERSIKLQPVPVPKVDDILSPHPDSQDLEENVEVSIQKPPATSSLSQKPTRSFKRTVGLSHDNSIEIATNTRKSKDADAEQLRQSSNKLSSSPSRHLGAAQTLPAYDEYDYHDLLEYVDEDYPQNAEDDEYEEEYEAGNINSVGPFSYGYKVDEKESGNFQTRTEERNGKNVVGSYEVALPDGRIQIVTYVADDEGFRAEVTYKGELKPFTDDPPSQMQDRERSPNRKKLRSQFSKSLDTDEGTLSKEALISRRKTVPLSNFHTTPTPPLLTTPIDINLSGNQFGGDYSNYEDDIEYPLSGINHINPRPIPGSIPVEEIPVYYDEGSISAPEDEYDYENQLKPDYFYENRPQPKPKPIPPPPHRSLARIPPNPFLKRKHRTTHKPIKPRPKKVSQNIGPPIHPLLRPGLFNRPVSLGNRFPFPGRDRFPAPPQQLPRPPFHHPLAPNAGVQFNSDKTRFPLNPGNRHPENRPDFRVPTTLPPKPVPDFGRRKNRGKLDFSPKENTPNSSPNPFRLVIDKSKTETFRPTQTPFFHPPNPTTALTPVPEIPVRSIPTDPPFPNHFTRNPFSTNEPGFQLHDLNNFDSLRTTTPSSIFESPPEFPQLHRPETHNPNTFALTPAPINSKLPEISPTGFPVTTPTPFLNNPTTKFLGHDPTRKPFLRTRLRKVPGLGRRAPRRQFLKIGPRRKPFRSRFGKKSFSSRRRLTPRPLDGPTRRPSIFKGSHDEIPSILENLDWPSVPEVSTILPSILKDLPGPSVLDRLASPFGRLSKPSKFKNTSPKKPSIPKMIHKGHSFDGPRTNPFFSNGPRSKSIVLGPKRDPFLLSGQPRQPLYLDGPTKKPLLFYYPREESDPTVLYNPQKPVLLRTLGRTHSIPLLLPIRRDGTSEVEVLQEASTKKRNFSVIPKANFSFADREFAFAKSDIYPVPYHIVSDNAED